MVSPILGEASGLVPHCQQLFSLLLNFTVDLIFVVFLYALHVGSTRVISVMVEKRKIKRGPKSDGRKTMPPTGAS